MRYLLFLLMLIATPVAAQQVPTSQVQIQLSYAPLVKDTTPAAVNIYAKTMSQRHRRPLALRVNMPKGDVIHV